MVSAGFVEEVNQKFHVNLIWKHLVHVLSLQINAKQKEWAAVIFGAAKTFDAKTGLYLKTIQTNPKQFA